MHKLFHIIFKSIYNSHLFLYKKNEWINLYGTGEKLKGKQGDVGVRRIYLFRIPMRHVSGGNGGEFVLWENYKPSM